MPQPVLTVFLIIAAIAIVVVLIAVIVIALRAQYNSAAPYDILLPVLVSGAAALILGILAVKLVYGRNKA